uniref:GLOBIN domain-containing protein n=1 Tax=Syphacia muris TaxID=451379 RepID=A0A0N5AYB4_9BILA
MASHAIITSCMDNARSDIAMRIITRTAHKRNDFATFCEALPHKEFLTFCNSVKQFLTDVVKHINSPSKISEISVQFGIDQAARRCCGFKADYFAAMADAIIIECVFLDGAVHPPTETIEAWATLVEPMFSNVRNGYYEQTRYTRKNNMFRQFSERSFDDSANNSPLHCSSPGTSSSKSHIPTPDVVISRF